VQGSAGRGRGAHTGNLSSTQVPKGPGAPRAARARGRGRGSATWTARGRGRGAAAVNHATNGTHQAAEVSGPGVAKSPFAQLNQQKSVASPFGAQPAQQSPFSKAADGSSNGAKNPFAKPATTMNRQMSGKLGGAGSNAAASMDNSSSMQSYQERFDKVSQPYHDDGKYDYKPYGTNCIAAQN
jgi:hypothetical protein